MRKRLILLIAMSIPFLLGACEVIERSTDSGSESVPTAIINMTAPADFSDPAYPEPYPNPYPYPLPIDFMIETTVGPSDDATLQTDEYGNPLPSDTTPQPTTAP